MASVKDNFFRKNNDMTGQSSISWESFNENYGSNICRSVPIRGVQKINDDEFSYGNTEEQEQQKLDLVMTPFGDQILGDKWSPLTMYELQVMHLRGPIADDPRLLDRLDKIQGVAAFHVVDRYTYIIAPGRLYSVTEVKQNVEEVLLNKSSFTPAIDIAKKELRENHENAETLEGMNLYSILYKNGTQLHINKLKSDSSFESELRDGLRAGAVLIAIKNKEELT